MGIGLSSMRCSTTSAFKACICDWPERLGQASIDSLSCVLAPRTIRACSRRGWPSKENVLRAEPQTEARMEWQFRFIAGGFYELMSFW